MDTIDPRLVLKTYLARAIAGETLSEAAIAAVAKRLCEIDPEPTAYEGNEDYYAEYARAIIDGLVA
jgi:hypothetical protein